MVLVLAFAAIACGEQGDDPEASTDAAELSLEIGDVPASVGGNVVTIPVELDGIELVKADGDTSGETGHLHAFIDKEPVDVGDVIPKEAGVVHSADNPVKLYGLAIGEHEITLVVGNGAHERIGESIEDSVTVEVEGPSVDATAPATIEEGDDLEVSIEADGVDIKAADGDDSGDSGHFHVLVDPETAPEAGAVVPEAEEGKIFHTAEESVTVEGLENGEHTIWVVLGDGTHTAFEPAVMDKLTVVVG
jgi:hypothetical protein